MLPIHLNEHLKSLRSWLVLLTFFLSLFCIYRVSLLDRITAPQQRINQGVFYLQDDDNQYRIEDIQMLADSAWQPVPSEQLSFGMTTASFWFSFSVNHLDQAKKWLLESEYPLLDHLDLWFYTESDLLAEYHLGDALPFNQRNILNERFLVPLPETNQPVRVIVHAQTSGAMKLPLNIWDEASYMLFSGEHNLMTGLFFGFIAALALSNFFFFATTGSVNFLIYSAFTLCLGLTLATLQGLTFKYLWPDSVWLQSKSIAVLANATCLFAVVFTYRLLDIGQHSRTIHRLLRYLAASFALSSLAALFIPYSLFVKVFLVALSLCILLLSIACLWLCIKRVRLARIYTLAWIPLLASALLASLDTLDYISLSVRADYLLMVGATIETTLFALVLALDYGQQRQQFMDAHNQALASERELRLTQEKVNAVQLQAREELEYSVGERTLELEIALRELSDKNRELEEINTIDALTGIRNRRYFDRKYIAEVRRSRREQTELSIAMVDIDHFKQVNDQYGHMVGDECIRFVAQTIAAIVKRPSDDVCRYGGEEFAILLPNTDQSGAISLLEQLTETFRKTPVSTAAGDIKLTISSGIATSVIQLEQNDFNLLESADKALYQAKNEGRDRIVFIPLSVTETIEN
ncbi:diguanylate cyclase [Neptunicella sp. SCSIO 80796]|uniref:sensor domain-containing diguanylate cyclase n=1 Tax=Neptunicella plasticusilytica TaxID=3117012 RepID=UPI003A4D5F85